MVLEKLTPYADTYVSIVKYCKGAKKIIILEEGMESGSFGQNVVSVDNREKRLGVSISHLAIRGEVPGHGRLETLYESCKISAKDIVEEAKK